MASRLPQEAETGFKEYLRDSGNVAGLEHISGLEQAGHKITVKGGGYIGWVSLDCVHGYDVFGDNRNKEKYAGILQTSSEIGSAAVTLAYCINDGGANILIKGDSEAAVKGYVRVVNDMFEREYDNGECPIGYPFRPAFECKEVKGAHAIWTALGDIHGYSEGNAESYPYNSYAYLMRGNNAANLVLGIELGITDIYTFGAELMSRVTYRTYRGKTGKEKLNAVLEDMRKRYVYPYARVKEGVISKIIGEACARCEKPYIKVAKKMKCYKNRHDLTVSTLCSFMLRRKSSFDESTTILGMGSENPNNLIIEALAEINRLTGYSYDYIVRKVMRVNDSGYGLLITTFIHLHAAYGWSFPEMCEKYHIVRDAMYIRAQCNF